MAPTLAEYRSARTREDAVRAHADESLAKVSAQYRRGLLTTGEYAEQVAIINTLAQAHADAQ